MSGGLAPSKTTVYISNLPFSLTNNDLHKIVEKYGQVVKTTVVKDKITRESKGIAFVLFLDKESTHKCVQGMNSKELFGRRIKCNLAKDNGRATEFIRRKNYTDKSKCYECGEEGHLSYACPKNALGDREPPKKKEKKRKKEMEDPDDYDDDYESDCDEEYESLSAAIKYQQQKVEQEECKLKVMTGENETSLSSQPIKKKIKKDNYFSDEEVSD